MDEWLGGWLVGWWFFDALRWMGGVGEMGWEWMALGLYVCSLYLLFLLTLIETRWSSRKMRGKKKLNEIERTNFTDSPCG